MKFEKTGNTTSNKSSQEAMDSLEQKSLHEAQPYDIDADKGDYMNPKQEEHFQQILLLWRQMLMQEVEKTMSHMQDESTNFPDPADRATREEEFSLELRTRDRERKLIHKIDQSLGLINSHHYGWCEQCGVEIGIRRLEARPTATLCVDCKAHDEIKENQTMS